ncbi:ABC transporter permease subunit [Mycoplasma enhydrae]|uniref:ABC transporter permease subunit n=1 Tax=Mycoplasma enhydrae TaxID=2499220 RepID=UPI00197C4588|nr:ABC transporter permease subunit [Mycoplasma enhydrae]MBN4089530.1 ABC transporter permease subunit [Mycoplasma enhydrae]MCV3753394.1 ABC transporter permease subunit [Mycoplasma enhydrae]
MNKSLLNLFKNIAFYFFIFFAALIIIFFAINILVEPQIKKNLAVYSSIPKNYGSRLGIFFKNLFAFNPGKIYSYELYSAESNILILYFKQFRWTILTSALIFSFSFVIGNVLGISSAYKFNKSYDITISVLASFFGALPLLIIAILALNNSSLFGYPSQFINNNKLSLISLLVPILISSFSTIAIFFSKSRKVTFESLKSNYYLFAKTQGQTKRQLLRKIIIKDVIASELNMFFMIYILLFTISILIERIFSIPGQSILISFAFKKGELDIIMFYFTFNFIFISILLVINSFIIKKLNPTIKKQSQLIPFWRISRRKLDVK